MAAQLSTEEAFLATRLDGYTAIDDIAQMIGKSLDETRRLLRGLVLKGLVDPGDGSPLPEPPKAAPSPGAKSSGDAAKKGAPPKDGEEDYGRFIFSISLMGESVDLDEETKKKVIFTHEHLESWTHYQLLKIPRESDGKAIKKAYFARSKDWHPDRFRKPNLGSFKPMIDKIYRRVRDSYEFLSDDAKRKEYDKTLPKEIDPNDIEKILREERLEERRKQRDEEKRAKRIQNNPVLMRMRQAEEFFEEAKKHRDDANFIEALRLAQMAAAYDERKPEYGRLVEELKLASGELRVGPFLKRAMHFEAMLEFEEAINLLEEAVKVAPTHGPARLRLAWCMINARRDKSEILPHAQRAASALPNEPEAQYVLGRLHEDLSNDKLARRCYERALELKPNYQDAKARLKKLKWGF
ncbi:MAG: DnaJ domain-containing protein [Deltaproteobacteria bacterium]|nr:DnaJ domain-containing protein [Deltaproteobacteria bacterium]